MSEVREFLSKPKASEGEKRIHLEVFPGEEELKSHVTAFGNKSGNIWRGRLCVMRGKELIADFVVVCGPKPSVEPTDGARAAHSTKDGTYVLGPAHAHQSSSWDWADIPSGWVFHTRRSNNPFKGDYLYAQPLGKKNQLDVTKTKSFRMDYEAKVAEFTKDHHAPPDEEKRVKLWNEVIEKFRRKTGGVFSMNPFGPVAFMLNHEDGRESQQLIHTTASDYQQYLNSHGFPTKISVPDVIDENDQSKQKLGIARHQALAIALGLSHGCIHIRCVDLLELIAKGYAMKGMKVIVHRYGKTGPKAPG